jgi:hypothetical protein
LLKFAPRGAIDEIKNYLLKYKKIYDDGIKWFFKLYNSTFAHRKS